MVLARNWYRKVRIYTPKGPANNWGIPFCPKQFKFKEEISEDEKESTNVLTPKIANINNS